MTMDHANGGISQANSEKETALLDPSRLDSISCLDPGGKAGLLNKVICLFIEKSPALLERMIAGVERNDAEEVYRAAHSLKSSSATVGANCLSETCGQLEMAGRQRALSEAPEFINRIQTQFNHVCSVLTRRIEGI